MEDEGLGDRVDETTDCLRFVPVDRRTDCGYDRVRHRDGDDRGTFRNSMVKEKLNSTRTYDLDGFRRRAACVCVRDDREQEVLLVSGGRKPGVWIVPGGGIEPTEDTSMAAIREVLEEAGVKGKLDRCLGIFDSLDGKTRTCVFVLIVNELLEDWDEAKTMGRQRKWFTVAEAKKHLGIHRPAHCSYLERLRPSDASSSSFVSS